MRAAVGSLHSSCVRLGYRLERGRYGVLIVFFAVIGAIAVVGGCGDTPSTPEPPPPEPAVLRERADTPSTPEPPPPEPAVPGERADTLSTPEPPLSEPAVDRIAYVDNQGQIWTVAPDGSDRKKVSPDELGFYTWPTWSPDARRLAFSGVVGESVEERRSVLFGLNMVSGNLGEIHVGERGFIGFVATNSPHYISWAPDSRRLAFLGTIPIGLRLYMDDVGDDAPPQPVLDQAPLYFAWSPDAARLLVHHGVDHVIVDAESGMVSDLAAASLGLGYRAPAWEPSGGTATYVAANGSGGYALYGSRSEREVLVDSVPEDSAFSWSPDGSFLAVTQPAFVVYGPLGLRVFRRVSLLRDGREPDTVGIDDNVVAFFWSPDSTKLAYVTLTDTPPTLRWMVLDVTDGMTWRLLDFVPTVEQLTVFQYFDQYAGSHQAWSPDSNSLVFAGSFADEAVSASTSRQQAGKVIVLRASRNPAAGAIADGIMGFWSPQ